LYPAGVVHFEDQPCMVCDFQGHASVVLTPKEDFIERAAIAAMQAMTSINIWTPKEIARHSIAQAQALYDALYPEGDPK
jgi:hypothetical protein